MHSKVKRSRPYHKNEKYKGEIDNEIQSSHIKTFEDGSEIAKLIKDDRDWRGWGDVTFKIIITAELLK